MGLETPSISTSSGVGGDYSYDKGSLVLGNYYKTPPESSRKSQVDPGYIIGGVIVFVAVVVLIAKKGKGK